MSFAATTAHAAAELDRGIAGLAAKVQLTTLLTGKIVF